MILQDLHERKLIDPPNFVLTNTHMLTIMGSNAYGVADTSVKDKIPDFDIYGFCMPPKEYMFPHLRNEIPGFGTPGPTFDQWQKAHILDKDALGGKGKEWDFQIFNIVKYFNLCMENNPNMIDSMFTPENCVIHTTEVGRMVRDNRKLFLSKLAWKKFRGYAWSQMHKMQSKSYANVFKFEKEHGIVYPTGTSLEQKKELVSERLSVLWNYDREIREHHANLTLYCNRKLTWYERFFGQVPFEGKAPEQPMKSLIFGNVGPHSLSGYAKDLSTIQKEGGRTEIVEKFGYDVKFGYHLLRLMDEAEQILLEGDIDLQRAREPMKAIRRGEWKEEDIYAWAMEKDKALEAAYTNCKLPERPPEAKIKKLLLNCIEAHYGTIQGFEEKDWAVMRLREIDKLISEDRNRLYN